MKREAFLFLPPLRVVLIGLPLILILCLSLAYYNRNKPPALSAPPLMPEVSPLVEESAEIKSTYREQMSDTAKVFKLNRECSLEGLEKIGLECGMTFLRAEAVLSKAGYEIRIDEGDQRTDGMPIGLSCGSGIQAVCSAGYKDSQGNPSDFALVFETVEGAHGAWVLSGKY